MQLQYQAKLTSCPVFKEADGPFSLSLFVLAGDVTFTVGSSLTSCVEAGLLIISMPKHFSLNSEVFNITAKSNSVDINCIIVIT